MSSDINVVSDVCCAVVLCLTVCSWTQHQQMLLMTLKSQLVKPFVTLIPFLLSVLRHLQIDLLDYGVSPVTINHWEANCNLGASR